jgi:hypothetical protein
VKKRALQIAVVLGLVGAAFAFRNRGRFAETPQSPGASRAVQPHDAAKAAVFDLFDAAQRGDVDAYLRLTSGELRDSLEDTRAQVGTEAFRDGLRRSASAVKGLAVTRAASAPPGLVALDVEMVFADRNERQKMLLAQRGRNGWVIASIEAARFVKPPIPYGTPVFEEPRSEETQGRSPPQAGMPAGADGPVESSTLSRRRPADDRARP